MIKQLNKDIGNVCRSGAPFILPLCCLLLLWGRTGAQSGWRSLPIDHMVSRDTIRKMGYTLVFLNQDSALDPKVRQGLIDAFFAVYPQEAAAYNPQALRSVIIFVDPAYQGVAATADGITRINPKWFHRNPEDIDVVTHEMMHIVQAYPSVAGPGWLTEGIADYARYTFGVNNAAAHWRLPSYSAGQNYTNSYRITARFLVWLEAKKQPGLVRQLDSVMRSGTYTAETWQQLTGKTVDEWWKVYTDNPNYE
jgi:hypothetical protein